MAFAKKHRRSPLLKELALPVISFAVIGGLTVYGIGRVGEKADEDLYSLMEQSVARTAFQCYAFEGEYPPDLEYMVENYGLFIDEIKYAVHYRNTGGNLLPQINVFPAEGQD